jgi:tetratricopeptide (TPR) repeat protein
VRLAAVGRLRQVGWMALAAGCSGASSSETDRPIQLVVRLGGLELPRAHAPRLSIPTVYHPCDTACRPAAARAPSAALLHVAEQAAARVQSELDTDALHAAALIDLEWADRGIPLERSVSYLRTVVGQLDRPAAALVDLSAALLVRAERNASTRDLVEAIEMADRARELDTNDPGARYNLALAVDRLGLESQAERAWTAYLKVDSSSGWAREARQRLAALRRPEPERPMRPAAWDDSAGVVRYAEAEPTDAMLWGWDQVLGAWGAAVLSGDSVAAGRHLATARALGTVVERRTGDSSLSDAVRAIDSASSKPLDLRELARGHREYAAARASYAADDNRGAEQAFERAYRLSRASRALAAWAAYSRGSPLVYLGKLDVADASVRRAIARADTARHPSVAARARWVRATTLLRRGRYEESIRAREAAALFTRTGERENLGAVLTIVADAERLIGDPARTFSAAGDAIRTLRPFRASEWLHNALYTAGRYTAGDGLPRAARRIHDEDVLVAERHPDPVYGVEALIERARAHAAVGEEAPAEADVKEARALVLRLPSGPREWFQADLQLAEAETVLRGKPVLARRALDSALTYWQSQQHTSRVVPVLVSRAEAALASGDAAAGSADFYRAMTALAGQSAATESIELRASLLSAVRRVADRLVMLAVNAGDPEGSGNRRSRAGFTDERQRITNPAAPTP